MKRTHCTVDNSYFLSVVLLLNRKTLEPVCFVILYLFFARKQIDQHEVIQVFWQLPLKKKEEIQPMLDNTTMCKSKFMCIQWYNFLLATLLRLICSKITSPIDSFPSIKTFVKNNTFWRNLCWIGSTDRASNLHLANGLPVIQPTTKCIVSSLIWNLT